MRTLRLIVFVVWSFACSYAAAADGWRLGAVGAIARADIASACADAKTFSGVPASATWNGATTVNANQMNCLWINGTTHTITGTIQRVVCASPNVISNGVCGVPTPVCNAGTVSRKFFSDGTGPIAATQPTSGGLPGFPTSDGNCQISNVELIDCFSEVNDDGKTRSFFCEFSGTQTGVATPAGSTPQPATPSEVKPDTPATTSPKSAGSGNSCPAGTVVLGTDSAGGMICGGSGSSPIVAGKTETVEPPTTVTEADGSSTKTEVRTRTNSDGSTTTTTTKTNTNSNGKVTVSTTQITGAATGGGAGKTSPSTDAEKNELCTKHPELNVCKNSSVAGECENTTCEGDAIQCAILRQQRTEYCENKKDTPEILLGKQLLAGNDPLKATIKTAMDGTEVDMAGQTLDQSGFAPAACFGNKTASINGHSISVNFASACNAASSIRYAVIALCTLVAFLIVARSLTQG